MTHTSLTAPTQPGPSLDFETRTMSGDRRHGRSRDRGMPIDQRHARLNTVTACALVFLVLAAPIPVASNRPVFWMFWAAALGALATFYLVGSLVIDPGRELRARRLSMLFCLAGLVPAFALIQLLPIAGILPDFLVALPATGTGAPASVSLVPSASVVGVVRFVSYIVFFALMLEVASRPSRATWIAWALFLGVTAHAVWAMISLTMLGDDFFWGEKEAYRGSATGTFINRNSFATFLGMGLVLGVALLLGQRKSRRDNVSSRPHLLSAEVMEGALLWLLICVIVMTLLATESRLGIVASAAGGVACFIVMIRKSGHNRVGALIGGLLVSGAGLIVLLLLFGRGMMERLIFVGVDSLTRGELFRQVAVMIRERPLTGYGLDAFPVAFELFHRPPLSPDVAWDFAHSTYLALWAELGILVGSIPLILTLMVCVRLVRIILRRKNDYTLAVAALSAIAIAAIHSLADFSLEIQANVFLLLALIAIGIAPRRAARSRGAQA